MPATLGFMTLVSLVVMMRVYIYIYEESNGIDLWCARWELSIIYWEEWGMFFLFILNYSWFLVLWFS